MANRNLRWFDLEERQREEHISVQKRELVRQMLQITIFNLQFLGGFMMAEKNGLFKESTMNGLLLYLFHTVFLVAMICGVMDFKVVLRETRSLIEIYIYLVIFGVGSNLILWNINDNWFLRVTGIISWAVGIIILNWNEFGKKCYGWVVENFSVGAFFLGSAFILVMSLLTMMVFPASTYLFIHARFNITS